MNPLTTLVILTLSTVTACASDGDSTSADEPTPSSSTASTSYTYLGDAQENTELTRGPYALAAYDSPTAPLFVVDVPSRYERFGLLAVRLA